MKYHGFELLVSQKEDEGWVSWTPQEPGLSSWGFNKKEALNGIQKSINEYISMKEGDDIKILQSK